VVVVSLSVSLPGGGLTKTTTMVPLGRHDDPDGV
jgi:hypothetical protein